MFCVEKRKKTQKKSIITSGNLKKKNKYLKTRESWKGDYKLKKVRMAKKCMYCNTRIDEESVIDICEKCGTEVWGERMFGAIKKNMALAKKESDQPNQN